MKHYSTAIAAASLLLVAYFAQAGEQPAPSADQFIATKNAEYDELFIEGLAISWIYSTYITYDSTQLQSRFDEKIAAWASDSVQESMRYTGAPMSAETARALSILRSDNSRPAPSDPDKRKELTELAIQLSTLYSTGKYCPDDGRDCLPGSELEELISTTRNYDEALDYWTGWRAISVPMRPRYARFVELANEGARELGYDDLGEMWRDNYDMSPDELRVEMERLWGQVKPLYDALHCHVRATLSEYYGEERVPTEGPMPAHLLGNMWAQNWARLYDLLEPYPGLARADITDKLVDENFSPQDMVRSAESFYVSMGLDPLPETFWERSMFTRPQDREVRCHASAWGMDGGKDIRIKMCINQTYSDLKVIYHELGHNYYQRAYKDQPAFFRDGAHGGFHEAIGDAVTLAMTPGYLASAGFLEETDSSAQSDINDQMLRALDEIPALPWTLLLDKWRWQVFSGEVKPADYNSSWWALREQYQGISAPVERSESDFDPGAKYHIPANVSYERYFLAAILKFQFYEALCKAAGHEGPLYTCSFAGSKEAGARLNAMMMAGRSKPWQDTLEKLTGTREMDGSAMVRYFQPLMVYLEEQNAGRQCGW